MIFNKSNGCEVSRRWWDPEPCLPLPAACPSGCIYTNDWGKGMLINLLVITARAALCSRCRGRIWHQQPLQVSMKVVGKGKQHPPALPGGPGPGADPNTLGTQPLAPWPGLCSSITPPGVTHRHQTCPQPCTLLRHWGARTARRHFNLNQLEKKQFKWQGNKRTL